MPPRARAQKIHRLPAMERHVAEVIRDTCVDHYKKHALRRGVGSRHGKKSVWNRIARYVSGKITPTGRVSIRMAHRSSALKEWGGFIHAGGPFAEPSKFHGQVSTKIPLALPRSAAKGMRLSIDHKHLRFDAPRGSPNKLTGIPLSHFMGTAPAKKEQARRWGARSAVVRMLEPEDREWGKRTIDWSDTPYGDLSDMGEQQVTGRWRGYRQSFYALLGNVAQETREGRELWGRANARQYRQALRKTYKQSILVGIRHEGGGPGGMVRKGQRTAWFEPLYILVEMGFIRAQPWMPSRRSVVGVIQSALRKTRTA